MGRGQVAAPTPLPEQTQHQSKGVTVVPVAHGPAALGQEHRQRPGVKAELPGDRRGLGATRPRPGSPGSPSPGWARHSAARMPNAKSSSWNKPQPGLVSTPAAASCTAQLLLP